MKQKDKILVVIIAIVGISFIIAGTALYKYSSNQETNDNTQNQETSNNNEQAKEVTIELTNEDGSNPYYQISNDIVELSKQAIPDATKINFSSQTEYFISLKELNEKYKIDISNFNNDSITCSIEETGALFIYTDEEIKRTSRVVCGAPTVIPPEAQLAE